MGRKKLGNVLFARRVPPVVAEKLNQVTSKYLAEYSPFAGILGGKQPAEPPKAWMGGCDMYGNESPAAENERLRKEVSRLQERIRELEGMEG